MKPEKISFCVHSLAAIDGKDDDDEGTEYKGLNIITFCPVSYWKQHDCLPDYNFAEDVWSDDLPMPEGYKWYICVEECQWATKKSKEDIQKDLTTIGFVYNLEMEKFLTDLDWGN